MTTEREYELAKGKLAEYAARKETVINSTLLSFPSEMTQADKTAAIESLKDVLSDAYFFLDTACKDCIEEFESEDYREAKREHSTHIHAIA